MGREHFQTAKRELLEDVARQILEECRMVIPGVQALFGFQLIAVFNQPFFEILDPEEQKLHLLALGLVALAIALLMSPAAYHRLVEPDRISRAFVTYATRVLAGAMLPLALAIAIDVYLVSDTILRSPAGSALLASCVLFTFLMLWFVYPLSCRVKQQS
jgi:hypothetical protein